MQKKKRKKEKEAEAKKVLAGSNLAHVRSLVSLKVKDTLHIVAFVCSLQSVRLHPLSFTYFILPPSIQNRKLPAPLTF